MATPYCSTPAAKVCRRVVSRISNGSCDESCQEPNFHNKRFAWRGLGRDLLLSMRRPGRLKMWGRGRHSALVGPQPLWAGGEWGGRSAPCASQLLLLSRLLSLCLLFRDPTFVLTMNWTSYRAILSRRAANPCLPC